MEGWPGINTYAFRGHGLGARDARVEFALVGDGVGVLVGGHFGFDVDYRASSDSIRLKRAEVEVVIGMRCGSDIRVLVEVIVIKYKVKR